MRDTPSYTAETLKILRDLILERTGIIYDDGRSYLLVEKLSPLVVERGLGSFLDYYYYLRDELDTEAEWKKVQDAISVNESYFWRGIEQVEAAADVLVPGLLRKHPGGTVRIWHAGCASGEEPYSMAIALEKRGLFNLGKIEIIGTDFSEKALQQARTGLYRPRSFRAITPEIQARYFAPEGNLMRLDESIRGRVKFERINLMDAASMASMRGFDIIFCRNVFIYFSPQAIQATTQRLYDALHLPGYLFVAAVESLLRVTTLFELVEVENAFAYKKE